MVHLGLLCPAETGHLNTMLPLGQEMQRRGHRVTFFGIVDARAKVLAAGLEFSSFGEVEFPAGSSDRLFAELGKLSGLAALNYTLDWIKKSAAVFLKDGPTVLKNAQIEALLVDQISPEGGTVADLFPARFRIALPAQAGTTRRAVAVAQEGHRAYPRGDRRAGAALSARHARV